MKVLDFTPFLCSFAIKRSSNSVTDSGNFVPGLWVLERLSLMLKYQQEI